MLGALLEAEKWKKRTALWPEARLEVKTLKTRHAQYKRHLKQTSSEAEMFSPLTQTENGNENTQVFHANGKKALCETEACIILQRWWKKHLEGQQQLFEDLVSELMDLRQEAALEEVTPQSRRSAEGRWPKEQLRLQSQRQMHWSANHPALAVAGLVFAVPQRRRQAQSETRKQRMVLDELRPYLQKDGGDVELIEIEGPILRLEMQGSCASCSSSAITVKTMLDRFPEIYEVEAVMPGFKVPTEEGIEEVISTIAPFLSVSGGSIELIELDDGEGVNPRPTIVLGIGGPPAKNASPMCLEGLDQKTPGESRRVTWLSLEGEASSVWSSQRAPAAIHTSIL
eukprot:s1242_g4.t1